MTDKARDPVQVLASHAWEGRRSAGAAPSTAAAASSYAALNGCPTSVGLLQDLSFGGAADRSGDGVTDTVEIVRGPSVVKEVLEHSYHKEPVAMGAKPLEGHPFQLCPPELTSTRREAPPASPARQRLSRHTEEALCAELRAACDVLRTQSAARAAARKEELRSVNAEVDNLRMSMEELEELAFGRTRLGVALLKNFREEVKTLEAEASHLRKRHSTLQMLMPSTAEESSAGFPSGVMGPNEFEETRRVTLTDMRAEAEDLQRQFGTQSETAAQRRSAMMSRCLEEVRSRLDAAKQRMAEAERDIAVLEPACQLCRQEVRIAEGTRQELHEELIRLQRTSSGLRAELRQLQTVREAIETAPDQAGAQIP
mmetsp:Transcript_53091/g.126660  ORF Transcript_53091/g.126660 Transcript_53091/m.126660 type:complete len:369 (+) Transcript_53091:87-1193(+)